jgi:hypothetical protein
MSASPRHFLPAELITAIIPVNRMATREYTEGGKHNSSREIWRGGGLIHGLSVEKLTHFLVLWCSGVWFNCQKYVMTFCGVLYCVISDETLMIRENFYIIRTSVMNILGKEYDILYKERSAVDIINNYRDVYYTSHDLAVNKTMIDFKEHFCLKQYMPRKLIVLSHTHIWRMANSEDCCLLGCSTV